MIYETYADLARRVRTWCRQLPEFVAVAGVPRSGQIVASMIAAERNIHHVHVQQLRDPNIYRPWAEPLRRNCPSRTPGDVLIVDDAVSSGNTIEQLRSWLNHPSLKFGAVYVQKAGRPLLDFAALDVSEEDHLFEWNVFHHWFTEQMLFDLDGILSENWLHGTEEGDLAEKYAEHLASARCLIKPSFPIGEIVTGRLGQYRPQTEAWLARHGIAYQRLTMAPFSTPQDRDIFGAAEWKASIYQCRPAAKMFIESCPHQAATIASATGRPILSWPENRFYNGAKI